MNLTALQQHLRLHPGDAMAWAMLAEALADAGDADAGVQAAQRALALAPGHPEALARLGYAQWLQGRHAQAVESLHAAALAAPRHPGIALWLGHALEDAGQAEQAAQAYERAHALAPGEPAIAAHLLAWRRKLCDWRGLDALSRQVREAVRQNTAVVEPFAFLSEDATPAEQLRCARLRAHVIAQSIQPMPPAPPRATAVPLQLGFLSNGFGAHPTGLLTVALFEALRDAHAQTHVFAINPDDGSDIRQRLQAATQLHEVSRLSHRATAQAIRDCAIDVLFDLRGWGGGGRPEVLAMRPARVQVNWLAFPGTSGAPWIDYVLADAFVLPPALAPHFSETVLRMPRCFQPSDTSRRIESPPPRETLGLPAQGTVFCCFNNSYKLNPRSMQRIFSVLRDTPQSVLWLLSGPGQADARLRQAAQTAGIASERLVFMPKQPHALYLANLRHADLFLDTHPYNAHTTASDALWAGCPVLTVPGETFASRVAGSLNHHLGMEEMNAADDAQFVAIATRLGNSAADLAAVKARLQECRSGSGVFDMQAFAADFLHAAQRMAAP